jgi:hypothetical protein
VVITETTRHAAETVVTAPTAPRASVDWARDSDAKGIDSLLATPLPGAIRLVLAERGVPKDAVRHAAIVARDPGGAILAHGARTVRAMRVGGAVRLVGYLHGLRRADADGDDERHLATGVRHLCATRLDDEADHDLAAIIATNRHARRVLENGLRGAPPYRMLGTYRTSIIAAGTATSWRVPDVEVKPLPRIAVGAAQRMVDAHAGDYAHVAVVTQAWISAWRGDRLLGVLRLVDRRGQRAEQIAGYAPALAWMRGITNLALRARSLPTLPPPGSSLDLVHAAHLTVPDQRNDVVRALICAAARASQARLVAVGLGDGHELSPTVSALPALKVDSVLYAVGGTAKPASFVSPEAAWL